MFHYVYVTTNLINGKMYIGKRSCHCEIEDDSYLGSGKVLKYAINKYGKQNFKREVVGIFKSEEDALISERNMIANYDACNDDMFYNIAIGGRGGDPNKGKPLEEKMITWEKISNSNSGENNWVKKRGGFTDLHKKNISLNHADVSGKNNPRFNSELIECEFCGEFYYVKMSILDKNSNNFCSWDCKVQAINHSGGNNPNSKKRTMVIKGVKYTKPSVRESIEFIKSEFNIPANPNWFNDASGVPKKYRDLIQISK